MLVSVDPAAIRKAFEPLKHSSAFAESAAVVARGGLPVEMLRAMSLRPELLHGFGVFGEAIYPGGIVEREVKELIILAVSHRNRCQFCESSHVAICRTIGMSDAPLSLLDDLSKLPVRQRLGVEYARAAIADSNRIPEALVTELKAAFTDPELVEVTAVIGMISMLNLFNNCLEVRYHDDYARVGS